MFFNNSPLLKIRQNLSDSYIDKGLLVNHYHCVDEEKTVWKSVKYACPLNDQSLKKAVSFSKVVDNLLIEIDFPTLWHYEEIVSEDNLLQVKFYKEDSSLYTLLILAQTPFGVCGTGLTTQEFKTNSNLDALVGYYDGEEAWNYVSFVDIKPYLHLENHGLDKNQANEFLNILKTLEIKDK